MSIFKDLNKQYIAGEWRDGRSTKIYEDTNPFNDEVVTTIKMATQLDIDEAYQSAQKAQVEWEKVSAFGKADIMEKAVAIMKARREEIIELIIQETGSTYLKANIMKKAALELGGNNPLIVLKDADIDRAVSSAVFGKFLHNGQVCMAINRIIVDKSIYDEFLDKLKTTVQKIKVGDPRNHENFIGPLINSKAVSRILEQIEKAKSQGARIVLEGRAEGNVMHPFIIAADSNDVETAKNETFGPVTTVIPFETEEEAIQIANDSPYGLSGAVHAGSIEKGVEIAEQIVTGMIHVNDQSVNDEPLVAFGGEKDSGLGRFGGHWSLDEFTTFKWISTQKLPREFPF